MQNRSAAQLAGNGRQSLPRQGLPLRQWQSSLPLQRLGSQLPTGGSDMGLGGQWEKDTKGRHCKQQFQSSLEVWPLWAQMECPCNRRTICGAGCPPCAREAGRKKTRQPSVRDGAPHLLAEWDWEANQRRDWHPDQITLGSQKKMHWVAQNECKLGLVHRWQATPPSRVYGHTGSPFPYGMALCACNSLAVQCPKAAHLWDFHSNGNLTPDAVALQSRKVVAWKSPHGRQWQQRVFEVVNNVRKRHISQMKQQS